MATTADLIKNSANAHLGITKYSQGHRKIIDTYNGVKPLPVGYAVTYHDDWCDAFVTYIGIINKITHLIGRECGVQRHLAIFKSLGIWMGKVRPKVGDIIIFDWQANGWADHIGFVTDVKGNYITTTEGNTNNRVGQNTFLWNDWRIVGYARPNYAETKPVEPQEVNDVIVQQVITGALGNGPERINNLKALGYDPDEVQQAVNEAVANVQEPEVIESETFLIYNDNVLTVDTVNDILNVARKYNINPVFLTVMLHFETLWGSAPSAVANNNWAGMTWTGNPNRPSGVVVSKGTPRPAIETGHYMKYADLEDFFTDWGYLLRAGGIYRVSGNKSFNESVKGLFQVGGAKYNYAASGYNHYLSGMNGRKNAIEKQNPGKLALIQKTFDESTTITGGEIIIEPESPEGDNKSLEVLAQEVINGSWGVGEDRVTRLNEAGYNYEEVQVKVNELLQVTALKNLDEIAQDVINGKYGNGKDRTEKLRQEGYDADKVQEKVNQLLKEDVTEVAKDVIRGQYGVGEARIRNLRAVGYNPQEVQERVNELLAA